MTPKIQSIWRYWPNPDDLAYMRSWLGQIPMVWESSSNVLASLTTQSDIAIEASIRDWIYWHFTWTGAQAGVPDPPAGLAVNNPRCLLEWFATAKDPTWSCGPLNCVKVGLLAACGIPARLVWSSNSETGAVDMVSEFWSASADQWVLTVPQLNTHFERQGRRLSLYDWATFDRASIPVQHVTISGQGAPRNYPDNFDHWRGMGGNPCICSGNANQADNYANWTPNQHFLALMPPLGAAVTLDGAVPYPDSATSIFGSPEELASV